jgi:hypothetical protein
MPEYVSKRPLGKDGRNGVHTILDPIMYCTKTTTIQTPKVAFRPKLLRNIKAIGWSLSHNASRSVPIQKANTMLMA